MENRLEARGWKLEVRGWKLEVRGERLEARSWMLEVRNEKLEARGKSLYSVVSKFMNEIKKLIRKSGLSPNLNRSNFYPLTSSLLGVAIMVIIQLSFTTTPSSAQSLLDYQTHAAENNPGLQAKYKDFEAALQKVPQVSSLSDPTFSFGYFISPVETRVGPQRARFSLSQMFPWFGTLEAQENAAALMADAKYQSFLDARNKLFYQVAAAYYPLYELNRMKAIEQENIDILQSYKNIATSKFENGNGAMVDVLRVDLMLKESQTNLEILEKKEKPLQVTLNKLLDREENKPVVVADSLEIELIEEDFRKDSLLTDNPILNELDLKIESSKASERAAHKQGLPKLGVGLDYVLIDERTDMTMDDNGKNALMPMVSVSIPIFRSKYKAAKKEAQLMQESYSFQKEQYENDLTSNYEMALFEIQQQAQLLDLYEAQIQESEQALNLLFSSYGNSGMGFEEVLRMQQQLLKYEKMKATAKTQYQVALAKLNYLTANSVLND